MEIIISENSDALSEKVADWLVNDIAHVLKTAERYTVSLSGGSTPKKLFRLLASDKYKSRVDWPRLHFFWGDERFVPFKDDRNNAAMTYAELLDKVPVNKDQIHIMRTELDPDAAVADYDKILHTYFAESGPSFDLVFLGLGDNAHTLSLFPNYPVIHEKKKWVTSFFLDEQDMYRITLTAPLVNRAAKVAFLVSGEDKAIAVKEIIAGERIADRFPAQVIKPEGDGLYWFLDKAAASALDAGK